MADYHVGLCELLKLMMNKLNRTNMRNKMSRLNDDRDCNRCLWATRDGGCASFDCEFVDKNEAYTAWKSQDKYAVWLNEVGMPLEFLTPASMIMCSRCKKITSPHHREWIENGEKMGIMTTPDTCPHCNAIMQKDLQT